MDPKLLDMARSGNADTVFLNRKIEEDQFYLMHLTSKGNTALHIACKFGHTEFVGKVTSLCPRLLLMKNLAGDTPLHFALRGGHTDVVYELIKCADREKVKLLEWIDQFKKFRLKVKLLEMVKEDRERLKEELLAMVDNGDWDRVKMKLQEMKDMEDRQRVKRKLMGMADMVDSKRPVEAIMLDLENAEGNTVLHEAAANRMGEVVKLLLEKAPCLAFVTNEVEASPLYVAAEKGCVVSVVRILRVVKDSEEVHCSGPQGRTPLHAAIIRGHLAIANILIKVRNETIVEYDDMDNLPVHYAIAGGHSETVRRMLNCDSTIGYVLDGKGHLPFLVAAGNGHVDVMKMLLKFCPDIGEGKAEKLKNALHVAAEKGNVQVVQYILSSTDLQDLINERDIDGNTPLHLAVTKYRHLVVSVLTNTNKVDVTIKNNKDKTCWDILESAKHSEKPTQRMLMQRDMINAGGGPDLAQREVAMDEYDVEIYKRTTSLISTVAGLIITASFAAAFTIPGGFNQDGLDKGKAIFSSKVLLWLFIITDNLALCTSICVELLSFLAVIGDDNLLVRSVSKSVRLMLISLISLALSFIFGSFLILSIPLASTATCIFIVVVGYVYRQDLSLFSPFSFLFFDLHINMGFLNKLYSRYVVYRLKLNSNSVPKENPHTDRPPLTPTSSHHTESSSLSNVQHVDSSHQPHSSAAAQEIQAADSVV